MKNITLFLLFFSSLIYAQEKKLVTENIFKINILSPGVSCEKGISKNTTIAVDANLSIGFNVHNNKTTVLAAPFLRTQYRYYYNLQKRLNKNKNIANNSGNYIAFNASHYFKPINNDVFISNLDGTTIGSVWGFQKTYKSNINLGANAGIGYNISNNQKNGVMPILNFTIGYVIGN